MNLKEFVKPVVLDNGLVRCDAQPHTKDIAALTSCCNGRTTGEYYFVCKYLDIPIDGEKILSEIAKLQDIDEDSEFFGCLRWYREEPCIRDSNGAFFVLKPIALAFLLCPDKIPQGEREIIMPVFQRAGLWFTHECDVGKFFYPNKIASDGAMLLLLSKITQSNEFKKRALEFWNDYMDYIENRGWGWGENTSKCYAEILNAAFEITLLCLEEGSEAYERLYGLRKILIDYSAFHGDFEYVPSIRTYTFDGSVIAAQGADLTNMKPELCVDSKGEASCYKLMNLILSQNAPQYVPKTDTNSFRTERIFGESSSSTFKGENIRLGTINRFPVMPGCYQNEEWGLGWQSMPVSVLAPKHELSFLRFASVSRGKLCTHPAYDKHSAYLHNHLFMDKNIPDIMTQCDQKDNMAVVVRSLGHLANEASYFADEWYFQHFDGEISMHKGWYVFNYGDCVLAVMPVNKNAELIQDGENVRLAQKFYEGDEKLLVCRHMVFCWAVVVLDHNEDWQSQLDDIQVSYTPKKDSTLPRPDTTPFRITCGDAVLDYEP